MAGKFNQSGAPVTPVVPELRRAFWSGAVVVVAIALSVAGVQATHVETERWVRHSREVARLARDAERLSVDRETAIRGFLLTHDSASLGPEVAARAALPAMLDTLHARVAADASQQRRLESIRSAMDTWERDFAVPAVRTGQLASVAGALAGKPLFDAIRAGFTSFLVAEEELYRARVASDHAVRSRGTLAIVAELALLAGILVWHRRRLLAQAARLELNQAHLEEQAVELELQTAELEVQTDELSDANAALARTENRYHSLVESAPYGVLVHAADRVVYANTTAVQVLGASAPEDLVGRLVLDFVHPESRDEARERIRTNVEDGVQSPLAELRMLRVDGTALHAEVTGIPFTFDGAPAAQVVLRDVGERKQLEAHLRQAQKMEAVGLLAGGVAHDFNNLLTVITAYGSLLLFSMPEEDERRNDVTEMCRAARRAAALTGQLLAFSRQQVLRPEVLDLNAVVRDTEAMLRRMIPENIRFATTLAPDLGAAYADSGQVEQVLMNLAVNARDAMPRGGTLTIETRDVDVDGRDGRLSGDVAPGAYVCIAVGDTGVGMDAATQAQIFEPFFTTKPIGEGTGLGLSTVYGIVKQSGGHLRVDSAVGRGTTFFVYLPRVETEAVERPRSGPYPALRTGGETVLLVEDDEAVRGALRRMLESMGYRVVEAQHDEDALALVAPVGATSTPTIDLVITDVVMPGLGGPALVDRLRELRPGIAVLFMSGYTDDALVRRQLVASGASFLQKPFAPAALAQKVREALARP